MDSKSPTAGLITALKGMLILFCLCCPTLFSNLSPQALPLFLPIAAIMGAVAGLVSSKKGLRARFLCSIGGAVGVVGAVLCQHFVYQATGLGDFAGRSGFRFLPTLAYWIGMAPGLLICAPVLQKADKVPATVPDQKDEDQK